MLSKKIIVLFDEYGNHTFNLKSNRIFVGVSAIYELEDEEDIFKKSDKIMGLSKSKPLKNDKINVSKAITISNELIKYPIEIDVRFINLDDSILINNLDNYKAFGDYTRKEYRGITKERKYAQILYPQLVETCLFSSISHFLEHNTEDIYDIEICVDNWEYPIPDIDLALKYASEKLELSISDLMNKFKINSIVTISNKQLLKDISSERKRFIDVITSVISKNFRDHNDKTYSSKPLEILTKGMGNKIRVEDSTEDSTAETSNSFYDSIVNKL